MTAPPEKSVQALIGQLCDEQLEANEMRRLNQILSSDLLAQQEYLDQLYMDGLLQYEFGGGKLPVTILPATLLPGMRGGVVSSIMPWPWLNVRMQFFVVAVVLAASCGFWWFHSETPTQFSLELKNSSFEESAVVLQKPTMVGWYGDSAQAVMGVRGVAPEHGSHMLRLERSASQAKGSCEIYQIVDMRTVPRLSEQPPLFVEASASVNSLSEDEGDVYVFAINLYASPDNPLSQHAPWPASWKNKLSFVGNQLAADYDQKSWEQIRSLLPLQSDTQFLLIQISVRPQSGVHDGDFPGQFVDNVRVRLTDLNSL
jgi:hypothetical protein